MLNRECPQWEKTLSDPSSIRLTKPRKHAGGVTMLMDKGLGLSQYSDLLETASDYIDFIKLGFGTSALYPPPVLLKKISLAEELEVELYPGGSFFEIAWVQDRLDHYLEALQAWGFKTLEISDGTINLSLQDRAYAIKKACSYGFHVLTECGKKISGSRVSGLEIKETLLHDLEYGAQFMIVEGRESGTNVGLYNSAGELDKEEVLSIQEHLGEELFSYLIWEAPQKQQQTDLIKHFGVNVNLGNIHPEEIFSVEALRRGLRSDTMQHILAQKSCANQALN